MNYFETSTDFLGLTPRQVAAQLGVTPSTVYAMISRKEIGSIKRGKSRFITQDHINEFHQRRSRLIIDGVDYTYAPRK
jgi:excisionase family DNA binding protein